MMINVEDICHMHLLAGTANDIWYKRDMLKLTHWGRTKWPPFSQTNISTDFFRMKMFEFRLRFHWNLFPRPQITIFHHWSRWWLGAGQGTSHYLNQWWLVYWHIYASLGLNQLKYCIPWDVSAHFMCNLQKIFWWNSFLVFKWVT